MTKKSALFLLGIILCITTVALASGRDETSLAGSWRFALDAGDQGTYEQWFARKLADRIHLPGTLQEQGFGNPPTLHEHWLVNDSSLQTFQNDPRYAPYRSDKHFESPFWLTPKRHYVGVAWYQRDIDIPGSWRGKRIVLHLERPHWETTVWVDGHLIGSNDSLGTAHDYELGNISAGRHTLSIRIDNRLNIPIGPHAHSITDMSQTDWNGIIGDISLIATDSLWLDDVRVYPDVLNRGLHVVAEIGNRTGQSVDATLTASVEHFGNKTFMQHIEAAGGKIEFDFPLAAAKPWDEFSPNLYRLHLGLSAARHQDQTEITFGLRQITHEGKQLMLNGHPIMVRGTLECCVFPLTGYPPMTIAPWRRIFKICQSYGLNHMRFHTWCPPEAAFKAADEMGMYLEVECSCWGKFGDGSALDQWMPGEGDRMLRAYGNHPSFMFMVATNEPKGQKAADFLGDVVQRWKTKDARRLYSAGAGAGEVNVPASDFHIEYATRFHQADGELTRPPTTADDYHAYVEAQAIPSIAHELGQWCAYPDFAEIKKFTRFLEPSSLEIFRDFLNRSGMGEEDAAFVNASGHFQALLYKAEIEKVLRTLHMGGFELLDLHDFPGQGYSPVGVMDEFWDSKGYITGKEYAHFAGATVPLARFGKLIFTNDETIVVPIEVCHFGKEDFRDAVVRWEVTDRHGRLLMPGAFEPVTIPTGGLTNVGTATISAAALPAPGELRLRVWIAGTKISNDWNFWVYPSRQNAEVSAGVMVAHDLSEQTLGKIADGGTALVLLSPKDVAGDAVDTFEPIFWNRVLFPKLQSQTLGILCDPRHPALAQFPTDGYSNWQWWDLQQNSKPMVLDGMPGKLKPIVQLIDDWITCRRLGLVVEAKVGKGKVLICSIDLQTDLANRPVARQMLESLLAYVDSKKFDPKVSLTSIQIQGLAKTRSPG